MNNTKDNILNSWIMVEHLSEGDIKVNKKSSLALVENGDYYKYISEKLDDRIRNREKEAEKQGEKVDIDKEKMKEKMGVAIYFDVFKFDEVLDLLRRKNNLASPVEEPNTSDKFTFSVCFSSELKEPDDDIFFTTCGYILRNQNIPDSGTFKDYEKDNKNDIQSLFKEVCDAASFNTAFGNMMTHFKCNPEKCYVKVLDNLESKTVNMHSFFIGDLEKAKKAKSNNLDAYLFKNCEERNLDSKNNPDLFKEILSPKNYPLGRFPSNTKYAASLMQQVAINLAIGYDNQQIRSVNGPPGTGKTTLLKDIFAELVVQQAYVMSKLKTPTLYGNESTAYDGEKSIASLPDDITNRNIVVASSNNGAVENIVNELPLDDGIDKNLLSELKDADYFYNLANKELDDGSSQSKAKVQKPKWGMFSMAGGKSQNMENIQKTVEAMCEDLDSADKPFVSDTGIYSQFCEQYERVESYRHIIDEHKNPSAKKKNRGFSLFKKNKREKYTDQIDFDAIKPLDMDADYDKLQLSNPYFDEIYRKMQSRLFIMALKVRKQFLYDNRHNLKAACDIWKHQWRYVNEKKASLIPIAWNWINLALPVIGSTFASFSGMCRNLPEDSIGYLFIDEAGQALPQASVGAIFRSKNVMAVGDPSQIKPVQTLDEYILGFLGNHFSVDETYLSVSSSTQTLIDRTSQYGYYKDKDTWIGIPLWVHRRCQYPMFTISNEIAYGGMMVQGITNDNLGKVGWYDVKGEAKDKYVEAQGKLLSDILKKMIQAEGSSLEKVKKEVYVITPFANVANKLVTELGKISFVDRDKDSKKPTNVGTVHTFQGKEAPIVFLVLGADEESSGAASWAVKEPNIMNVAATRAKKEFYIIGDRSLYKKVGGRVIDKTDKAIRDYTEKHPELVPSDCKGEIIIEETEKKIVTDEVKSAKLTADGDTRLKAVERGESLSDDYMSDITNFDSGLCTKHEQVDNSVSFGNKKSSEALGKCPRCGADVKKGRYGFFCTGKCGMKIGKVYGEELTETEVKKLLDGKEILFTLKEKKKVIKVKPEATEHEYNGKTYIQWRTGK
ncbi:MAG: AAA domain-containing protein [Ruminococcus sp.]|nr:AAA domain-containing protein [Ruminococcus sp.]